MLSLYRHCLKVRPINLTQPFAPKRLAHHSSLPGLLVKVSPDVLHGQLREVEQGLALELVLYGVTEFTSEAPQLGHLDLSGIRIRLVCPFI